MYPHRIRLRGPWECEPLARAGGGPLPPPCRITMPCRWGEAGLADFAGRLADAEVELMALEYTALRVLANEAAGRGSGNEASYLKIKGTELNQLLGELACEVMGYAIPARTTVFMSQWAMHRDPRWFHEPEKFDPARWAGGLAGRLPKFAYFPFGGGPRLCVGNTFAMVEAVLALATLARRFRFELAPGQEIVPWPSMTLRPKYGVKVVLHRV